MLYAVEPGLFKGRQAARRPSSWCASPGGTRFDVEKSSPRDLNSFGNTPIPFARVWQGKIDTRFETHNGVKFGPADEDVAYATTLRMANPRPSAPCCGLHESG